MLSATPSARPDVPRTTGALILADPPSPTMTASTGCGAWRRRLHAGLACTIAAATLAVGPGCVRVYHPMTGLHDPVVVDPSEPNFRDTVLTVRCLPGQLLSTQQSVQLCRKVALLFENQGAQVLTYVSEGTTSDERREDEDDLAAEAAEERRRLGTTRLELVLRSRETHRASHALTWAAFGISFGILPGVDERSFALDLEVRDSDGFLLVQDTLEGRMVRYVGASTWVGNKILDWTVRDDDEDLTGDASNRQMSDDLYRQLSQHVFNAKMRAQVLQLDTAPLAPLAPLATPASAPSGLDTLDALREPQDLPGLGGLGLRGAGSEPEGAQE